MLRRVALTCQAVEGLGGAGTLIRGYLRLFSETAEVLVVSSDPAQRTEGICRLRIWGRGAQFPIYRFPFFFLYMLQGFLLLVMEGRRRRFDVVYAQDGVFTGLYSALAGRVLQCPVIIMDYGALTNLLQRAFWTYRGTPELRVRKSRWLAQANVALLRPAAMLTAVGTALLADAHIVVGEELGEIYRKVLKVPQQRLVRGTYAVDTERFRPPTAERRAMLRQVWGFPTQGTIIASVSRLAPEKGFEYFLPAVAELLADRGDAFVVIAGEGPLRETIDQWITERGLSEKILLVGPVPHEKIPDLLGASDVFCFHGTIGSNLALALLEAMASGCAVVATTGYRAHEALLEGGAGFAVPPGSTAALCTPLRRLLDSPDLRAEVGQRARQRIIEHHSFAALRAQLPGLGAPLPVRTRGRGAVSRGGS